MVAPDCLAGGVILQHFFCITFMTVQPVWDSVTPKSAQVSIFVATGANVSLQFGSMVWAGVLFDEAAAHGVGQLGQRRGEIAEQAVVDDDWGQVRIGEEPVVVRVLFRALTVRALHLLKNEEDESILIEKANRRKASMRACVRMDQ